MMRHRRGFVRVGAVLVMTVAATTAWSQAKKSGGGGLLPGGNSKDPVSIDAGKLDYFDKENRLVYSGGVVAKQGEGTLKASTLVIFLTRDTPAAAVAGATTTPAAATEGASAGPSASASQVRRMEAEGPVTITQADQVGVGDSGIYDRADNKIYLIGHVSLSRGSDVVRGDKLTYDLNTSQAAVTGSRVNSIFTPGTTNSDPKKTKPADPPKR